MADELPRQTRSHSIDEQEPLPDLSAMPDPRGLKAEGLQAGTSLDQLLAPGQGMFVPQSAEPQGLPQRELPYYRGPGGRILQSMGLTTPVSPLAEHMAANLFPGVNLTDGEKRKLGAMALTDQFMQQRQTAASKMMELQDKQQQHAEGKILAVWQDHNMPLAQKKKVSEQYGRQYGSALGINLAKMANDDLVAKSEIYQKYLPPGKYQELRAILQTPNADLSPVEHWAKWAEDRHKVNVESGAKSERFSQLLQQHQASPLDSHSPEFDELKQMVQERTKRQEEAVKLNLEIQGLNLGQKKTQTETDILQSKPSFVGDYRTPEGGIGSKFFNPRTMKTEDLVGMPLQRVQTQDMTAATKTKNTEILDQGENVMGIIQQYRNVLRPENVGLLGDMRGIVFGTGQQSDAFAQLLKGQANAVVDQLGQSGGSVNVSNFFDPKLSKSELLGNILTYQLAFINSPDGRVSNDDFKIAKQSLGVDKLLTGAGDISAKLNALEEVVTRRMDIAKRRLGTGEAKQPKFKTIDEYKKARGIK